MLVEHNPGYRTDFVTQERITMAFAEPSAAPVADRERRAYRSFRAQVYTYCFFDEFILIYPLYAVMFAEHGLSAFRISLLFAAWSLSGLVLEVPSGALADKYSRKHIMLCAQAVRIVGFAAWMVHPTFWGFLTGFVCWGASGAFCSGTFEALVFDELRSFGRENDYARVTGTGRSLCEIAVLTASLLAAPLARLGYPTLIALSLVSMAVSCIPLLLLQPVAKSESTREAEYLHLLRLGIHEALDNRTIRGLMVFVCFALVIGALDEYWPVIGHRVGLSREWVSIFVATDCAFGACANMLAHRFERISDRWFYVAYAFAGLLLLVTAVWMRPPGMLPILAFTFIMRTSSVVFEARVQHAISVQARATVLSVKGFFTEIGAITVFLGFGACSDHSGYGFALGACAVLMVVIGLLYAFTMRR